MKMLLEGKWVDRGKKIDVQNPYDGSVIDTVPAGTAEDVDKAVAAAVKGFEEYKKYPAFKRMEILDKTARFIKERREEFARTIATEGSKTIREARLEVSRCINTIAISAEEARRICGETLPFDSFPNGVNKRGFYYRFPIGVVAAITPFNDPLNLVAHKLGPAFAAGNAVVLKPATVTPLSALKLAEVLLESGLPPMALQVVTGYGHEIGDALVSDPRVRMISFTGGVEAGLHITKLAGLKKIGMELGSNSPTIVMADADLEPAVESCVSGAFWAVGQNCIGVQRLLVHAPIYDEFRDKFTARTKKYRIGPQLDETTDMGPMITEGEAKRVEAWIKEAVQAGAKLLAGGRREYTRVEPTVLENVPAGAKVDCDEVFGPVVNLYKVADIDEAIEKANAVNFGLHAAIFTKDVNTALKAAYELDCGGVIINESTDYRLDMMPFGGVKNSGLGREGIKFSLLEMTEPKVVCFNIG
jgi:glyceraldehyde-3-phosphate dehydrogenase (NADP+)